MPFQYPALCFAACLFLVPTTAAAQRHYSMDDFASVEKIDAHMHIHTEDLDFVALSKRDGFRFLNMAVWTSQPAVNLEKHRTIHLQHAADPDRTTPVCSFPIENWDDPDWPQQTIAFLDAQFAKGAVGVKIWKNVGMELRDKHGQLVMVNDPKLAPVIAHIEACGKVLLGHLGEPKNCWLPLSEMTTLNDRSYFQEHPKYHMHRHPEMPNYEDQIAARDAMLAQHPNIKFVGCHLASLEWSVEEIAAFLDRFPNAVVGLAARMGQVQYQTQNNRQAVIDFFVKYQDRILYGTDTGVGPKSNSVAEHADVRKKWLRDWAFFNSDQEQHVPELAKPVRGIHLPASVVDKIYRDNALRVFSHSWPGLQNEIRQSQVASLGWLSGTWSGEENGVTTEESWLAPRGGVMLGVNRTTKGDLPGGFEFMRIATTDDGVFLYASPRGNPAVAFRLVELSSPADGVPRIVFENPNNDFPQRITYSLKDQKVHAEISGTTGGQQHTMGWTWSRATH